MGDVEASPRRQTVAAAAAQLHTIANPSIIIVGAGIGGITMALDLDRKGLTNWIIVDREDAVGGTWYVNRYPGCRCDIPAVAYSHSRFTNSQWSQTHPDHDEICQYWQDIVRTQGITNRLRLETDYVKADWDDDQKLYRVTLRDLKTGEESQVEAQFIIASTGFFSEPRRIPLPGEEEFKGKVIHAARWPRDLKPSDLRGKNVVVVGNGCSGVQIVGTLGLDPEINLVSLARTQQWLMPSITGGMKAARNSKPYSDKVRAIRYRFPWLQRLERVIMLAVIDMNFYYQWQDSGAKARRKMEKKIGAWMRERAPPHLKDKIVPTFSFQAKRYVFEDGYFAAINSPHCKAVYGRIEAFTPEGVKVDDGSVLPADYVVLATGFNAEHIDLEVSGDKDSTNNYKTKADLTWYHGVTLPGIPNYFNMSGNNFLVNHSSVTEVLEIQSSYITQMIAGMRDAGVLKVEVKREAAERYDRWIENRLKQTIWGEVANYWRKEGTGRIFTHYPGPVLHQWWDNAWPVWADYNGAERLAARQARRKAIATAVILLVLVATGWRNQAALRSALAYILSGAPLGELRNRTVGLLRYATGLVHNARARIGV